MIKRLANGIFTREGTNMPLAIQVVFASLIVLVFFQEFINYISPISLRYVYFLFYAYFLFDGTVAGLMKNRTLTLLGAAILLLVGYGMAIFGAEPSVANATSFISTTYPFVAYLFVRNNRYLFDPKLYRFFYILLMFIAVFGFFEYFFAQYFLADLVARFGRGITDDYLESGLYLQKVNTNLLGIYRSMSFIMEFVYFGYYAMFAFFISATKCFYEGGWSRLVWAALAFMGLCSSVTMSAVGMAMVGLALLIAFKGSMRAKIVAGGGVAAAILTAIPVIMTLDKDVAFKPLLRVTKILAGEDAALAGHLGVRLEVIPLLGKSWRTLYEHEYFDALYRLGIYGGSLYIGLSAFFLFKALRMIKLSGRYQAQVVPIALLFIGFLAIGFTHHTLRVGVSALAFIFLAMIENSCNDEASRAPPSREPELVDAPLLSGSL